MLPASEACLTNRAQRIEALGGALSARTTAEWIEIFGGRVPARRVNDRQAALENPSAAQRGRLRTVDHPTSPMRLLAPSINCPGEDLPCTPAPAMGADTDAILGQAGFSRIDIAELHAAGMI